MPINFARVPKHVRRVADTAKDLHLPATFATWKKTLPLRKVEKAEKACESFLLPLLALVCSDRPLDTALPIGWRLFEQRPTGRSEIRIDNVSDRKAKLLSVSGVSADRVTVTEASQLFRKAGIKGDFDARILSVPPIIPSALWMKRHGRGSDRLIIMESNTPALAAGTVTTDRRFISALIGPARKLLEFEPESIEGLKWS
jgi:hypothetical protein